MTPPSPSRRLLLTTFLVLASVSVHHTAAAGAGIGASAAVETVDFSRKTPVVGGRSGGGGENPTTPLGGLRPAPEQQQQAEVGGGGGGGDDEDTNTPAPTPAPSPSPNESSTTPAPTDDDNSHNKHHHHSGADVAIGVVLSLTLLGVIVWASYTFRFQIATCCRNCTASLRRYGLRGWVLYLIGRRPDADSGEATLNEIIFDPDEQVGTSDMGRGLLSS